MKCTDSDIPDAPEFPFPLKKKNYDDLRLTGLIAPRILVVVYVPKEPEQWIESLPCEMVLRRCAFWQSLANAPESGNESTVTIHIPAAQTLQYNRYASS